MVTADKLQQNVSECLASHLENGNISWTYDSDNLTSVLWPCRLDMANETLNSSVHDNSELLRFLYLLELFSYLCPVFFSVVFLIGVCGNGLVIYVISSKSYLRTCPNMLFLNLAVADLLFLLFCVPLQGAVYIDYTLVLGEHVCKLFKYTVFVTMSVSAYTLVAICVFRCVAIASPLQSSITLRKRHSALASLMIWVAMSAVNTPVAIFYTEERHRHCQFLYYLKYQMFLFNAITIGIDFLLPMVVFCGGTMFIIHKLRKRNEAMYKISESQRKTMDTEHWRRNTRKLVILVVSVAIVFFLSWLPFQLIALVNTIQTSPYVFSTVAQLLAFANSCINPIIYNFASAGFRRAFISALKCCSTSQVRRIITGDATRSSNADIPLKTRGTRKRLVPNHHVEASVTPE